VYTGFSGLISTQDFLGPTSILDFLDLTSGTRYLNLIKVSSVAKVSSACFEFHKG